MLIKFAKKKQFLPHLKLLQNFFLSHLRCKPYFDVNLLKPAEIFEIQA